MWSETKFQNSYWCAGLLLGCPESNFTNLKVTEMPQSYSLFYELIMAVFTGWIYNLVPTFYKCRDHILKERLGLRSKESKDGGFYLLIVFEFFSVQKILHWPKQMEICWGNVRRIRWMRNDVPAKRFEFFLDEFRNVRPGIVVQQMHFRFCRTQSLNCLP